MSETIIENVKIGKPSISMEDHGCLTFTIPLLGYGWACGFGGYEIGHGYLDSDDFSGSGVGLEAMMRIMDVVGVDKWENLEGKMARVQRDYSGSASITIIGNIMKDKWFDIKEFFSKKIEEQPKKPMPENVDELRTEVGNFLVNKYSDVHMRTLDTDIIVKVKEYSNGRNDVWIQFPYFHSR